MISFRVKLSGGGVDSDLLPQRTGKTGTGDRGLPEAAGELRKLEGPRTVPESNGDQHWGGQGSEHRLLPHFLFLG